MRSGRVAVVLGTRPEIVKLTPLLALLGADASLIHTGQHYDATMSGLFLDSGGRPVDRQLEVGALARGAQVAAALQGLEVHFHAQRPTAVVVQGDTNSALAGALAANACELPLVHVEAGLRSYDRSMPEEHNRVAIDHLADLLCAPTDSAVANLAREAITRGVELTGNTVVEALLARLPEEAARRSTLVAHGVEADRFVLATIHRPENTDDPDRLEAVLRALGKLPLPVLLPAHPRTRLAVERHGLADLLDDVVLLDPLGHEEFLSLAAHCALLVSDSGGLQEECTVLKRPIIVVRNSTERPESMPAFATLAQPDEVLPAALDVLDDLGARHRALADLPSPYGDGHASERIAEHIRTLTSSST
jgi:UDP-N-acetylglucosamine 2-epimerase (non-hydrolysing)